MYLCIEVVLRDTKILLKKRILHFPLSKVIDFFNYWRGGSGENCVCTRQSWGGGFKAIFMLSEHRIKGTPLKPWKIKNK